MALISRSDDLRRQNQRRILAALRRHGPMSRTELSAITGLSASTITAITAGLLDSRAVMETPAADAALSRRGRPQVTLALNPAVAVVGALSLSLNRISAAIVDYSGTVIAEEVRRVVTHDADAGELTEVLADTLRSAIAGCSTALGPLRHIALGVQGVTDSAGTTMLWSPITRHVDLQLGRLLEDAFAVPVVLANDCNTIAQALRWRDPDRFGTSFAAVLLSHGIGMGLFLGNGLLGGIRSSAAEFGHMSYSHGGAQCRCGRRGCIEAYAGDYAIWRAAHMLDPLSQPVEDIDTEVMTRIAERARQEEGPERQAYRVAGHAIGAGLRSMFALFDPFPVAFVGSGAAAFDLMEPAIRETIGESAIGMATSSVEMHCFPDEFPLVRDGAAISALNYVDSHLFASAEPGTGMQPERSLRHAM